MGSVYRRKDSPVLWIAFYDVLGNRKARATQCPVGEEDEARKILEAIERQVEAEKRTGVKGPPTVSSFGSRWMKTRNERGLAMAHEDEKRLARYIYPKLGRILLKELRPHHVRDFVRDLRKRPSKKGGTLAPRTVRGIYGTLNCMLHDAVADELISVNPCTLRKGELPPNRDKDPTWRALAVFTRFEVEQLISDERIPEDRRTLYALAFLTGQRFGELAACRWRDYDDKLEPLGKLLVARSYSSRQKSEKGTKTDVPREVPVHPTLAKVLAHWKLGGWQRRFGRAPGPDDLILPKWELGKRGPTGHRNVNRAKRRWDSDCRKLKLRTRRQHDTRRTFTSLARADGAREDLVTWIVHGPPESMLDRYTTFPWASLCAEVSKLKIELLEGRVLDIPEAASE